ncbi:hypothetical protein OSTOST_12590, partial [Ostertagia ostertagi]
YQFKKLLKPILGARYEGEYNRLRNRNNDTLRASAYSFDIVTAYLKTAADARTGYGLAYIFRRDQLPRFTSFLQQSHSQTIEMNTSLARWKNHRITFTGSYRELIVDDSTFNNQKAEQTLLGRFEYTGSLLRNVVQVQTLYEFGSGQEQKKSYTYLEVPAGQGLYYWVDYNGDGVQQKSLRYPDGRLNVLGEKITQNWPIKLYGTYAATEMQTAFTDCSAGMGGHHQPDLIIIEILDNEGRQLPDGTPGEIVITTLGIEGMPLLRYRTGDMAILYAEPCSCGRHSKRLSHVTGRKQQMIKYKGTTLYPPAIFDMLNEGYREQ